MAQGIDILVSTLLDLTVVGSLLDEVQELLAQGLIGDGPGDTSFLSHCDGVDSCRWREMKRSSETKSFEKWLTQRITAV
jgi:hypothetical protein